MSKEETILPVVQDDQYIEFYENNPDTIHFDPPLTLEEFGATFTSKFQLWKNG